MHLSPEKEIVPALARRSKMLPWCNSGTKLRLAVVFHGLPRFAPCIALRPVEFGVTDIFGLVEVEDFLGDVGCMITSALERFGDG